MLVCALHGLKYCQGAAMQSLYPVEKAIRLGGPLSIGGQGQELRYVSDLYIPAHGILADAVRPRYAAISALPSRQQFLYFVALCVRANGADPTQHSSSFPPPSSPQVPPSSRAPFTCCTVHSAADEDVVKRTSSLVGNPDAPTHSALAPNASRVCSSSGMPLFTATSPSSTRRPAQNQRSMLPRTTPTPPA